MAEHSFAGSLKRTAMVEVDGRSPLAEKKGGERTLLCGYIRQVDRVSFTTICSPARRFVLSKIKVGVRCLPRRKRRPERRRRVLSGCL